MTDTKGFFWTKTCADASDPGFPQWYVAPSSGARTTNTQFGLPGDVPAGSSYFGYLASATPNLQLENLTHPDLAPTFVAGDTYRITIVGPPNQPVTLVQNVNGSTSNQSFGNTDSYGRLIVDYVEQTGNIGTYTQVWSVGGNQAATALTFIVGEYGSGTLTSTDIATNSTGQIEGVSSISIANGTVSTYSVTALDYQTSLYYDAETVGTVYEDGNIVRSAIASGGSAAGGYLSYTATLWKDYTLATDHYVTAFGPSGGPYYNPYYFDSDSCDDYSSDCTFVPYGGDLYITTAVIYLGSTATEKTNVALDGTDVPLADNDAFTDFLSKVPGPTQSQLSNLKYQWSKLIQDYRLAGLAIAGAYAKQKQNYQIPLFLKLIHDDMTSLPPVERVRRYKVLDVYGNSWNSVNPLRIDERLIYVAGSNPMPAINAPGWCIGCPGTNDLRDGPGATLEDTYSVNSLQVDKTQEVDYWQRYYASNFNAPQATFPDAPLPGAVLGGVPLILILPASPTSTSQDNITNCGNFGLQSIRLTYPSVQFNGDNGPHGVCAYR